MGSRYYSIRSEVDGYVREIRNSSLLWGRKLYKNNHTILLVSTPYLTPEVGPPQSNPVQSHF